MKILVTIISAIAAYVLVVAEPVEPQGVGSCYEVQPICVGGGRPTCMCTVTLQCYWVCK